MQCTQYMLPASSVTKNYVHKLKIINNQHHVCMNNVQHYYKDNDGDYVTQLERQIPELRNKVRRLKSENREGGAARMSYGGHIGGQRPIWCFLIKILLFWRSICFLDSSSLTRGGYSLNLGRVFASCKVSPTNLPRQRVCQRVGSNYCSNNCEKIHWYEESEQQSLYHILTWVLW